uniref:hypothetical protein n=1 Tax=Fulvivirga sp. TaxID=1931237 RepID=UPI004049E740
MKKLFSKLFIVGALGGLTLLASCGGDDDEPTPAGPSVVVTTSPAAVDGVVNLTIGEELTITVNASTPGGFNVARLSGAVTTELDRNDLGLDADATSAEFSFDPIVFNSAGDATITVTVIDNIIVDGASQQVSEDIEIVVTGTPLNESEVVLLGGPQNAATGSYYNAVDETVYNTSQAFTAGNTNKVDFVFWYGATSLYAIGAVDDANAVTAFDSQAGINLANLNPKSISRFKTFTAVQDFEGTTTSEQLDALFPSDGEGDLTRVAELEVGDIFGITLDAGRGSKKGLIKVEEIIGDTPSTRAIRILVKIQP